jgi:class 3 adenylate cyclase
MRLEQFSMASKPPNITGAAGGSMSRPMERRWGAVLAADVVEYSRLTSLNEEKTYFLYKSHRYELIDPKIIEHGARFVKSTGDGILAEFATVLDAARCAVQVQQSMLERCKDEPNDHRIVFRIGLSCGRIIADPEDIYGHEVNVAARLQTVAPPGGIAMSSNFARLIRKTLPLQLDDLGLQHFRNMSRAVHVFQCRYFGEPEC